MERNQPSWTDGLMCWDRFWFGEALLMMLANMSGVGLQDLKKQARRWGLPIDIPSALTSACRQAEKPQWFDPISVAKSCSDTCPNTWSIALVASISATLM